MFTYEQLAPHIQDKFVTVDNKQCEWSFAVMHARKANVPLKCDCCGEHVSHFDIVNGRIHAFVKKQGKDVILTRDHIIPKSFGGTYSIRNVRLFCQQCNNNRGNSFTLTEAVDVIIRMWGQAGKDHLHVVQANKNIPRLKLTNEKKLIRQLASNGVVIL